MHMTWNDPNLRAFKRGDFYVGTTLDGLTEVGVTPDTAALTIAKARSGKGAGVMIPNLLRWPESALVIDPKGEAAAATAEEREQRFGMPSYVLAPFHPEYPCNVPQRLLARFNPLDEIDLSKSFAREDILTLADGIIMRHNAKDEYWEGGGAGYLAGVIAYVAAEAPLEFRTLQKVDDLVNSADPLDLWERMSECEAAGKLAQKAGRRMIASPKQAEHFNQTVLGNTSWLAAESIESVMLESTFRLSDLRTKGCTVYLVLPPDMIKAHPHFLRLFVMAAIRAMGRHDSGRRCLFLLDEFYALGHIAETDKAAGLLPGYGVHLWPFLQNIGQLVELYGPQASGAFIENADLLQFFGLGPGDTADFVSRKLGVVDHREIQAPPPVQSHRDEIEFLNAMREIGGGKENPFYGLIDRHIEDLRIDDQNKMHAYQHQARLHGTPRVTPDEVVSLIAKDGTPLAQAQIAFIKGAPYLLGLRGWFEDKPHSATASKIETNQKFRIDTERLDTQRVGRLSCILCEWDPRYNKPKRYDTSQAAFNANLFLMRMLSRYIDQPEIYNLDDRAFLAYMIQHHEDELQPPREMGFIERLFN